MTASRIAPSSRPDCRRKRVIGTLLWSLAGLFLSIGPGMTAAETAGTLQQNLEQRQKTMRVHEELLKGLSEKERRLFGNLQEVEARWRSIVEEVEELESVLDRLREKEREQLQAYQDLDLARSRTSEELGRLLTMLWPVHLQGMEQHLQTLTTWDEADRQFHWLSRIYELVQERIDRLRVQGRELALSQARLDRAREEINDQMDRVNASKDRLLKEKLEVLRRVQEVRAQQVSTEEHITVILQSITELQYQLQTMTTRTFTDFRGHMPWPAQGQILERFQPQAVPPHRGLSMALAENTPVRAVSMGKVVHSDVLRGYGHVVILYHGEDYYSLYAFLNEASVSVGQEVEKDEQLGVAGFYPKADGPGLYFELRFQQNPVNPDIWLVAK